MDIDNWMIGFIDIILLHLKAQRRIENTFETPKIKRFAKIVNSFQF